MKKRRLVLSKETLRHLQGSSLQRMNGALFQEGDTYTCGFDTCGHWHCYDTFECNTDPTYGGTCLSTCC